eukprot:6907939-Ditylum_brightwellii.AAC.1
MYASLLSRKNVRTAFTYAALNNLDVWAAGIQNAYLQAPSSQRHYIVCGAEFGLENVGKQELIRKALYDPDVWMRSAIYSDGSKHCEYILLYVDDALAIEEHPEKLLCLGIGKYFQLNEESVGPPKIYIGGSVHKRTLHNGVKAWVFSSLQYYQTALKSIAEYLEKRNDPRWAMPAKAETPMR